MGQYGEETDVILLVEEDHFDPRYSGWEQDVIADVSPEYVLLEKDNNKDVEEVLAAETHTLFNREKKGRSQFFQYLRQQLDEKKIDEVVFCDDLPDGVDKFFYAVYAKTESERLKEIDEHRETYMAEKVSEYTQQSDRPIVAILGYDHTREGSTLLDELDQEDISYTVEHLPEGQEGIEV